jgi:ABC-type transporter Mla subunit MlaD
MTEKEPTTVEMSLEALSHALSRAADDLRAAVPAIDRARADIASRNSSISREVVRDAEKVLDHLRHADESLREVVTDLAERD